MDKVNTTDRRAAANIALPKSGQFVRYQPSVLLKNFCAPRQDIASNARLRQAVKR